MSKENSSSDKKENSSGLPPSYDQVEVNNATAPYLNQTFAESIFGTSTIVTFELESGSFPGI